MFDAATTFERRFSGDAMTNLCGRVRFESPPPIPDQISPYVRELVVADRTLFWFDTAAAASDDVDVTAAMSFYQDWQDSFEVLSHVDPHGQLLQIQQITSSLIRDADGIEYRVFGDLDLEGVAVIPAERAPGLQQDLEAVEYNLDLVRTAGLKITGSYDSALIFSLQPKGKILVDELTYVVRVHPDDGFIIEYSDEALDIRSTVKAPGLYPIGTDIVQVGGDTEGKLPIDVAAALRPVLDQYGLPVFVTKISAAEVFAPVIERLHHLAAVAASRRAPLELLAVPADRLPGEAAD